MFLLFKIFFVLLHILSLPLHFLLFSGLIIYKLIVRLCAKLFQNFVGPIPSPNCVCLGDPLWQKPSYSIVMAAEFDEKFTRDEYIESIQEVYNARDRDGQRCYKELAYRLVLYYGHGFWKEVTDFQHISDRVHMLEDKLKEDISKPPSKFDKLTYKQYLTSIVEHLQRLPYKKDEPLWDAYILKNYYGNPKRNLLFIRWHHFIADGMSVVKFFYALSGYSELPEAFTKPSNSLKQWNHLATNSLVKMGTILYCLTIGYVDFLNQFTLQQDKNELQFYNNGKLKFTGDWMSTIGDKLDIEEFKRSSKAYNCSIVHILLAAVGSGVEEYMVKYGSRPLPEGFNFMGSVPIPGHPNMRLVNHWCLAKMFAKTRIYDISARLKYYKVETAKCAEGVLPVMSAFMFQYAMGYLTSLVIKEMSKAKAAATVVFSNIVGPQNNELLIAGSVVEDAMFWMPIAEESMAISVGVISCNGGIRICLNADTGCIPEREQLEALSGMIYSELSDIFSSKAISKDNRSAVTATIENTLH